jgi:hypothetical protein
MMKIKSLYNRQYERRALYSDFLEELINNVKKNVQNYLKIFSIP